MSGFDLSNISDLFHGSTEEVKYPDVAYGKNKE
jgi:hypothetical protein